MSENKLPTAKECLVMYHDGKSYDIDHISSIMIEFARMHVIAALEAAKETTALSEWSEEDDCCIAKTNKFQIDLCYRPEYIK